MRRSQSSKPPIVLVVFHRELRSEFAARIALWDAHHYRTDAGQSPDMHRIRRALLEFRILAQPSRMNTIRQARPLWPSGLLTKTVGTPGKSKSLPHNKFTHVTRSPLTVPLQLPIGDDVSPLLRRRRRRGFGPCR